MSALSDAIDRTAEEKRLTPSETNILSQAAHGLISQAEIAKLRGVKYVTVRKQVHRIIRKFGTRSLAHAVVIVLHRAIDRLESPTAT